MGGMVSQVPKCEGPGAPRFVVGLAPTERGPPAVKQVPRILLPRFKPMCVSGEAVLRCRPKQLFR